MGMVLKLFPQIFDQVFRKFLIVPAAQNKCERLFSMVGRFISPRSRNIKIETIERKVVVGSAVLLRGFIFDFKGGNESSSSEEADMKATLNLSASYARSSMHVIIISHIFFYNTMLYSAFIKIIKIMLI